MRLRDLLGQRISGQVVVGVEQPVSREAGDRRRRDRRRYVLVSDETGRVERVRVSDQAVLLADYERRCCAGMVAYDAAWRESTSLQP